MPLSITRPGKIVCVGLNYHDHAEEGGQDLPTAPLLFAKWPNTLIGDGEPIVLPEESTQVDYEAELGVVIGASVRNASAENALEAVAGYICVNDVSARDLQFADGQWTRGKSPDTFCPVGPRLVSREEIDASVVVLTRDSNAFETKASHLASHPAVTLHDGDVIHVRVAGS